MFPAATAPGTAARAPFVLLIVVLLGSGLITLLLLNSALNQGSFELSKLERKTDELTDEQQALQQEVDAYSAPGALERRARRLGMVPGGAPVFLLPDGKVLGKPGVATSDGAPLSSSAAPSASALLGTAALSAPAGPSAAPSAAVAPPAVRPRSPPRPPPSARRARRPRQPHSAAPARRPPPPHPRPRRPARRAPSRCPHRPAPSPTTSGR
ncbi:septum formation initiator family protein [Streptomyces lydicus]|nr:septum formation initiator family protein [Streptomyces lydicus]